MDHWTTSFARGAAAEALSTLTLYGSTWPATTQNGSLERTTVWLASLRRLLRNGSSYMRPQVPCSKPPSGNPALCLHLGWVFDDGRFCRGIDECGNGARECLHLSRRHARENRVQRRTAG